MLPRSALVSLLLTSLLALPALGQAKDPAANLPAGVLAYLGTTGVDDLLTKARQTPMGQMFMDKKFMETMLSQPGMKEGLDQITEGLNEMARELGFASYEEIPYPSGPMGLAVYAEGEKVHVVMFADLGEKKASIEEVLNKMVAKQLDEDPQAKRSTEEVEGEKVVVLRKGESEDAVHYLISGNSFLLANNMDIMTKTLRLMKGKGEPLSKSDVYRKLQTACQPMGEISMIVDIAGLAKLGLATGGDADGQASKALDYTGLLKIKPMVGTVRMAHPGPTDMSVHIYMPVEGLNPKVLAIVDRNKPLAELADAAGLTPDVASAMVFSLRLDKVYDMAMDIADSAEPGTRAMAEGQIKDMELPNGQRLNLLDNFINKMIGPVSFQMSLKKPYDEASLQMALGLGHNDAKAVGDVIKTLTGMAPFFQTEEFLGTTVYNIPEGLLPMEMPFELGFAVTGRALALGMSESVRSTIRSEKGEASKLSESEAFKNMTKSLPRDGVLLFYSDPIVMQDFAEEMVKSGKGKESSNPLIQMMFGELDADYVELSRKFATYSVGVLRQAENGTVWEFVGIASPAPKKGE